jgi:uncharacterized protein (DUF433 family)
MTNRIAIDPEVCGGRPIVAGTRMRVADVPYLTHEDIIACLAYGARAVDHAVVQAAA